MRLSTVFAVLAAMSTEAAAQEYFGEFAGDPAGRWVDPTEGRPTFKLSEPFKFEDPNGMSWVVPSGIEVDGASIPQFFWTFIGGPFEGKYLWASVIHDYYCDTEQRTAHDTHRNFWNGMLAKGVDRWQADAMYWAVATFGPQWTLEKPKDMLPATSLLRTIAFKKMEAFQATLAATDGRVFDVTSDGAVAAQPDAIAASAERYRVLLSSPEFLLHPEVLGIMGGAAEDPAFLRGLAAVEVTDPILTTLGAGEAFVLAPPADVAEIAAARDAAAANAAQQTTAAMQAQASANELREKIENLPPIMVGAEILGAREWPKQAAALEEKAASLRSSAAQLSNVSSQLTEDLEQRLEAIYWEGAAN